MKLKESKKNIKEELNKSKNPKIINKNEEKNNFINQKNIQQDLLFFKNDILKDLRAIQRKLNEDLIIQKDEQENKLNIYEKKIEAQSEKITYLSNLITESMKKTKVEELLEKLSNKTEENFSKVDFKINNIQKEIRDGLYKHEKFFNESILYPGIIGYECRFANFHSFIDYVLSKIQQLIIYQEVLKGYEFHKLKGRLDKDISIIRLQLKNNFQSLTQFTTEKINESEKRIENKLEDYNSKFVDIRVENNEVANILTNKINEVSNSFGKIVEIKKEIEEKYDQQDKKIEDIKLDITNNETKLKEQKNDISKFEKKFDLLTTYVDNKLIQNSYNNNMNISRNNMTSKGRRFRSAKAYIEGWINDITDKDNIKKDKKFKKFNFKAESFIKRYIKGKIGIGDMYKHPKDFQIESDEEDKKTSEIKLQNQPLSEKTLIKNKLNNNQQFFSLTTVKSIKYNKSYKNISNNIINKSNKDNSSLNKKSNLGTSKNNIQNSTLNNKKDNNNSTTQIKKTNQSYELKKRNNLSFNSKDKTKNLYMDNLDLERSKNINLSIKKRLRNNSSQTNRLTKQIKIDYVTRIPDIEINRISYPDKDTKRNIIMTKSLSDGNYNIAKQSYINVEDYFEKKKKKAKQKIKYNFKSPNNYNSKFQTFGNKFIRQQFAKEKIPNLLLRKPKKKLLIIQ